MITERDKQKALDQRLEALKRANGVRGRRAILKQELGDGRRDVRAILVKPPWWAEGMRLQDLLEAVPKLGPVKVGQLSRRTRVPLGVEIGSLSRGQQAAVIGELNARGWAR